MPACGSPLEPKGSGLELVKSMFNAESSICRLSWSISSHFGTIYSCNVCCSPKSQKRITKNPYFRGSSSFKVVDLDVNRKGVRDFLLVINSNLGPILGPTPTPVGRYMSATFGGTCVCHVKCTGTTRLSKTKTTLAQGHWCTAMKQFATRHRCMQHTVTVPPWTKNISVYAVRSFSTFVVVLTVFT